MRQIIDQGAEGRIYKEDFFGRPAIVKERFIKSYRHPCLDKQLSYQRLKSEVRCISRCRAAGIATPALYFIDQQSRKIYMEFIEDSETVKKHILSHLKACKVDIETLAENMGITIARMHGENMIHGDLTTSNFLLNRSTMQLTVIDFGLGQTEVAPEDKAVDLYVLERAILSTHPTLSGFFDKVLCSYIKTNGKFADEVITKLEEVRTRGRKRTMIG